ncbi:hypothetical protein BDA99DRAFT_534820 [Phascolomyces articulosus]|uniref:Uncharacterized protein n=1 Tax=Phascolomyces articulosus TaxID=60185 RepID=A0AAD5PGR6_9FUNG|nr:hypothetical protein BDA99DRAFT_534820 [Phascolomyces articulosus]
MGYDIFIEKKFKAICVLSLVYAAVFALLLIGSYRIYILAHRHTIYSVIKYSPLSQNDREYLLLEKEQEKTVIQNYPDVSGEAPDKGQVAVIAHDHHNILEIMSSHHINNQRSFSGAKKNHCIYNCCSISNSTNELYPALPTIQKDLNTMATVTNITRTFLFFSIYITVAVPLIMIGPLSSIWASYADVYGILTIEYISDK